jgi:hypothetical protein
MVGVNAHGFENYQGKGISSFDVVIEMIHLEFGTGKALQDFRWLSDIRGRLFCFLATEASHATDPDGRKRERESAGM